MVSLVILIFEVILGPSVKLREAYKFPFTEKQTVIMCVVSGLYIRYINIRQNKNTNNVSCFVHYVISRPTAIGMTMTLI